VTEKVTSADGTTIAFEVHGEGLPLVLVGGALCDRGSHRPLAQHLAADAAGVTYDRRGRGDSGDTAPYDLEREVEDLAAVVDAVGGSAVVYGHSSGAGLALEAAIGGVRIDRLILHEPPYNPDDENLRQESVEYADNLDRILADGRSDDAVRLFMSIVGMPPDAIQAAEAEPWWPAVGRQAPHPAGPAAPQGRPTPAGGAPPSGDHLGRVHVPTLVLGGGASPPWMLDIGRRLAEDLPDGRHEILEDQGHEVAPEVLAPALVAFADA
jgi:pimeloyl-ACP methyl ester carboxylesterase